MCVHARDSVLCRTRAHAAGNGFVVRKRLACPRMRAGEESTDGEIVHRSGRGGRNQIRHGLRQRAKKGVDDALRHLNVPSGHCRRRTGVYYSSLRCNYPNRSHHARRRWNVFRQQTTKYIEACRVRDRFDSIDTTLDLRIAASEVNRH